MHTCAFLSLPGNCSPTETHGRHTAMSKHKSVCVIPCDSRTTPDLVYCDSELGREVRREWRTPGSGSFRSSQNRTLPRFWIHSIHCTNSDVEVWKTIPRVSTMRAFGSFHLHYVAVKSLEVMNQILYSWLCDVKPPVFIPLGTSLNSL